MNLSCVAPPSLFSFQGFSLLGTGEHHIPQDVPSHYIRKFILLQAPIVISFVNEECLGLLRIKLYTNSYQAPAHKVPTGQASRIWQIISTIEIYPSTQRVLHTAYSVEPLPLERVLADSGSAYGKQAYLRRGGYLYVYW